MRNVPHLLLACTLLPSPQLLTRGEGYKKLAQWLF